MIFIAARGIFNRILGTLSCGIWELVSRPGIEAGPPTWEARSLSHWTPREVPEWGFLTAQLLGAFGAHYDLPEARFSLWCSQAALLRGTYFSIEHLTGTSASWNPL